MRALLIGHGYMAHGLAREMHSRRYEIHGNDIPAAKMSWENIVCQINHYSPDVVVNAAAFCPTPTVDECKNHPEANIHGNLRLPTMLAQACSEAMPQPVLIQISTGCLFDESREWTEKDIPTRRGDGYCGAYIGMKLMAEAYVGQYERSYILRIRLPFDEQDHPKNYLSKLAGFSNVLPHVNSLTHRGDFAKAALDLFEKKAEFGIYHVVNPGYSEAEELASVMAMKGLKQPGFTVVPNNTSGCRLSTRKLEDAGIKMRFVEDALIDSLENWKPMTKEPNV